MTKIGRNSKGGLTPTNDNQSTKEKSIKVQ